ncbi:DUF4870 domain-containing protein [candidate division KSB1 bacterium]|nr:DUF4870 domain-containing protein [candidate division KSB1 bacterium]
MEEQNQLKQQKDAQLWATLCHLSGFAGFVFPFGNIIAPLVLWLLKRDEYELVDDQGKEALNFQISVTIYLFISALLILIVIGFVLLVVVAILAIVVTIMAAVKTSEGNRYQYPFTIRLIK